MRASSLAAAILLGLFLAASAPLLRAPTSQAGPNLVCDPIEGADSLFTGPETAVILIDGLGPEAAAGAGALGCLAAARGGRVLLAAEEGLAGELGRLARRLAAGGALATFAALGPAGAGGDQRPEDAQSEGEARAAAYAAALSTGAPPSGHRIVALAAPDAARAPVGLTGFTWRPLGARLPDGETISLRAEASAQPGVRLKLRPFEDIPLHGAALRYDGIVEIGPATNVGAP